MSHAVWQMPLAVLVLACGNPFLAQTGQAQTGPELNAIQTAVPFLMIVPDARAGGMGEIGASSKPDVHSQYWNVAKFPFAGSRFGMALSCTPWISELCNSVCLASLAGYYKIDDNQAISASFRYFSMERIIFTSGYGTPQGIYLPNEFALDAGYSKKLSPHFSWGITLRYIHSDLTGRRAVGGSDSKPAMAIAGDLGCYYQKPLVRMKKLDGILGWGIHVSNIGNKISYTADQKKAFLPINLRLGAAFTTNVKGRHSISIMSDINKLLVPTPPIWLTTGTGTVTFTPSGQPVVQYGKNPYVSTPAGMLQSFWDAPGVLGEDGTRNRLQEELNEIAFGVGLEYGYHDILSVRGGYFHEHESKGSRKYFTVGVGLHYRFLLLDGSYLIPVKPHHPLKNTYRLTVSMTLGRIT